MPAGFCLPGWARPAPEQCLAWGWLRDGLGLVLGWLGDSEQHPGVALLPPCSWQGSSRWVLRSSPLLSPRGGVVAIKHS